VPKKTKNSFAWATVTNTIKTRAQEAAARSWAIDLHAVQYRQRILISAMDCMTIFILIAV
jgi:hypothetical protein